MLLAIGNAFCAKTMQRQRPSQNHSLFPQVGLHFFWNVPLLRGARVERARQKSCEYNTDWIRAHNVIPRIHASVRVRAVHTHTPTRALTQQPPVVCANIIETLSDRLMGGSMMCFCVLRTEFSKNFVYPNSDTISCWPKNRCVSVLYESVSLLYVLCSGNIEICVECNGSFFFVAHASLLCSVRSNIFSLCIGIELPRG